MDVRNEWFGRNNNNGTVSFRFGPMNCGKTRDTVTAMQNRHHEGGNIICYNHAANSRDGDCLAVDGERQMPAVLTSTLDELILDLEMQVNKIFSRKVNEQGEQGKIEINGITHRKYRPVVAIAIDEVNLYAMNSTDSEDLLDFFDWCREVGLNVYSSGLMYDFRGRDFGHIRSILPRIEHILPVTSAKCKSVHQGQVCGEPAYNSQRVWRLDFLHSQKLEEIGEGMALYDFADKEGETIVGQYVAAPFFDRTLRIEEAKDGRVEYFPVCQSCFTVPFKDEVFMMYHEVIRNPQKPSDLIKKLSNKRLSLAVLKFLQGEVFDDGRNLPGSQWIYQNEKGILIPMPNFRTPVGTYEFFK
tara:strand:+ start:522 stop:1592 length:1071 start_codon:yes stop_codon:yes gene_type:complete